MSDAPLFNISDKDLNINILFCIQTYSETINDTLSFLSNKSHFLIGIDPWDYLHETKHFAVADTNIQTFTTYNKLKFYYTIEKQIVDDGKIRYKAYLVTIVNDNILWINCKYYQKTDFEKILNVMNNISTI